MEWLKVTKKLSNYYQKYKFVALIILIGIVLMIIPTGNSSVKSTESNLHAEESTYVDQEQKLQEILETIHGAGKVRVMLTQVYSEENIYQCDTDIRSDDENTSSNMQTVIITDQNRNQSGLVTTTRAPIYQGAIIVCQGADDPTVKLSIVDAVSKATGLSTDKISVLKMR